ncbi:hypothetical protein ACO9S2_17495 [Nitrospira sp. NS4]
MAASQDALLKMPDGQDLIRCDDPSKSFHRHRYSPQVVPGSCGVRDLLLSSKFLTIL